MKITKSLLAASFAFTAIANAQEAPSFSLSGEFRPRTEWFGGGVSKTAVAGTDGYVATNIRAALNATYTSESYTLYTSFRDVFTVGDRQQIQLNSNSNLRVQEAWADIKLSDLSSLKIGRQAVAYDDQRILGGLDWANQGRTHDLAIYKYKNKGYSLDVAYGLNSQGKDNVYDTSQNFSYREMFFARANKKYGDLNISALVLSNTFQDNKGDGNATPANFPGTDNKSTLLTAGFHLAYAKDALTLKANGFIQDGLRLGDTAVKGAFLASLDAKYKVSDKLTAGLGYEIISGKKDDSAAFFPLYGTNHLFNGLMDRFYVGNHANAGGLKDAYASVSTKVAGIALTLTGHSFKEQSLTEKDLGTELDFVVAKQFKGYKLVGGYSQFFEPSAVADLATTKGTQNWAWLMLIIKPKFL